MSTTAGGLLARHVALPADHGSWLLLAGPLAIGLAAAPERSTPSLYLVLAALAAFLARQPITLAVKAYSGRRSREVLRTAWFWIAAYGGIAGAMLLGLILRGYGFVLYLALPGLPIFAWYLALVARRAERRQQLMEVLAAGALALAAPAGYWIGAGGTDLAGFWLWGAAWALTATAIVHAYLRLQQRVLRAAPDWPQSLRMARVSVLCSSSALAAVFVLGRAEILPPWLFVAYAVQWIEALYAVARPAVGYKPQAIGWRQLAVSVAGIVLFIVMWRT